MWHNTLANTTKHMHNTSTCTNMKALQLQGMSLITGRPFSAEAGFRLLCWKERLKDQGSVLSPVSSHIFIRFQGFKCIPGLFHWAMFSILCPFDVWLSVAYVHFFSNSHGGKILHICLILRQVCLEKKTKSICWCWKYFLNNSLQPKLPHKSSYVLF